MTLSPSRCVALAAALLCAACAPAARTPVAPPPAAPALAPARQADPAPARQAGPAPTSAMGFDLSVRNLMRGEGLVGRSPNELRWSPDSRWVYFRWRSSEAKDTTTSLYRVAAAGGAPEPLPDSVSDWTAPAQGEDGWSLDGTARVFERRGDIFVAWTNGTERRITDTPARERAPQLSPDGRTVYFLSGNNLFAVELAGGTLRQLTDVRTEDAPKPDSAKGHRRFLEEEQRRLFGVVRDRVAEREHRERQDSLRTRVRPLYLGRNAAL
ncbi:MAG TPA: hypothetical protein VFX98_17190, partial [Longimicrobiaceae bacterium]|nr:hypothetical protein [Longimicrobiaceae bacterium]